MVRKLIPFAGSAAFALLVVAAADVVSSKPGFVYGLAGFLGGVLVVLGVPFAFGRPFKHAAAEGEE